MTTARRNRTHVLSVHKTRFVARIHERELQHRLDRNEQGIRTHAGIALPEWARGVRVEKAGAFLWTLTATEKSGR